mgnify:CR=1 FL=1
MFSDHTVFATHHVKNVDTQRYYSPDGRLDLVLIDNGYRINSKWEVKNNKLCHKIGNQKIKCREVHDNNGIINVITPWGDIGMTFRDFKKGNHISSVN